MNWAARWRGEATDGCDKACARKILAAAGFFECGHVELGALGLEKGKSPVNEENIERAVAAAKGALAGLEA